jgi:hypothetical protein
MRKTAILFLTVFLLFSAKVSGICIEIVLVRPYVSAHSGKECLAIFWCDGKKVRRCWDFDATLLETEINKPMGTATVTYTVPSYKRKGYCEDSEDLDTKICRFWRTFKKTINLTALEEEKGCADLEEELRAVPRDYYE